MSDNRPTKYQTGSYYAQQRWSFCLSQDEEGSGDDEADEAMKLIDNLTLTPRPWAAMKNSKKVRKIVVGIITSVPMLFFSIKNQSCVIHPSVVLCYHGNHGNESMQCHLRLLQYNQWPWAVRIQWHCIDQWAALYSEGYSDHHIMNAHCPSPRFQYSSVILKSWCWGFLSTG